MITNIITIKITNIINIKNQYVDIRLTSCFYLIKLAIAHRANSSPAK